MRWKAGLSAGALRKSAPLREILGIGEQLLRAGQQRLRGAMPQKHVNRAQLVLGVEHPDGRDPDPVQRGDGRVTLESIECLSLRLVVDHVAAQLVQIALAV